MERSLYELNGVEFAVPKTPTKWRTKIGRSFLYIYTIYFCIVSRSFIRLRSPLASQPARNSIRRVTNLPEGKWIEASFLKEVRSRVSVKYYYLQWNCWVSPFFCRWVGIVERFFFIFSTPRILYRTQQRGKTPFRGFINSVLESADELIKHFRFFFRFLQMEPITFDMKDAQGSTKHHLVFVLK
jgi:hypothetical protein